MKRVKIYAAFALILVSLMFLPGCVGQEEEPPQTITQTMVTTEEGKEITKTVVTTKAPETTMPGAVPERLIFSQVGSHFALIKFGMDPACDSLQAPTIPLVYETLFELNPVKLKDGINEVVPWLAKDYTVSADGLTWDIELREGIKFHSGNEFTADDAVYSLIRHWKSEWGPLIPLQPNAHNLYMDPDDIVSVTKTSTYMMQIKLRARIANFLGYLSGTQYSIIDSKVVEAHNVSLAAAGGAYDHGWTWLGPETHGEGTGPYKVKDIDLAVRYDFERNDNYWGGPSEYNLPTPQFKEIRIVPIQEEADARMQLQRGDVHVLSDMLPETALALENADAAQIYRAYSPYGMGLWMHCINGPLKNWEVRKAMKMALNYTQIKYLATFGAAEITQGFFMAGMSRWTEAARYFDDAQFAAANALLDPLYPKGADGFRFSVKMYLRQEPRFGLDFINLGLVVRENLAQIGIEVIPIVLHVAEYYAHVQNPPEDCMWVQPFDTTSMPGDPQYLAASWGQSVDYDNFGFNETTQAGQPEAVAAIAEIRALMTEAADQPDAERIATLLEVNELSLEYGAYVTIANALYHVGYNNNIHNFAWGAKQLVPLVFWMEWS